MRLCFPLPRIHAHTRTRARTPVHVHTHTHTNTCACTHWPVEILEITSEDPGENENAWVCPADQRRKRSCILKTVLRRFLRSWRTTGPRIMQGNTMQIEKDPGAREDH